MQDPSGGSVEIIGIVEQKARARENGEPDVYYYAGQEDVPFRDDVPVTFRVPVLPPVAMGTLDLKVVSSDYFGVMGLERVAGRLFTDGGEPGLCRVGVINEQAAELYFGGAAVGGAVIDGARRRTAILGVVREVPVRATQRRIEPTLYMSQLFLARMHMIAGAVEATPHLQETIRRRIAAVEGGKTDAVSVMALEERLRRTALSSERIAALLLTAASINAAIIGILGLHRHVCRRRAAAPPRDRRPIGTRRSRPALIQMAAPARGLQQNMAEVRAMQKNSVLACQVLLLVLAALSSSGCEVIGGIFKAGVWGGVIVVVLIIALVGFLAAKMRG